MQEWAIFPAFKVERAEPPWLQIQRHLEQLIRSQTLLPGARLPTTRKLAEKWGVHFKTIQQAMRQLCAGGLILRRPGAGTFVAAAGNRPQVGILVGPRLLDENMGYYRAITQAVQTELDARGLASCVYDNLADDRNGVGLVDRERLMSDMRNRALKGIILYAMPEGAVRKTALDGSLPCVWHGGPPGRAPVRMDLGHLFNTAVDYLVRKRRQRFFYLLFAQPLTGIEMVNAFRAAVIARGLAVRRDSVAYVETVAEQATYEYSLRLIGQWKARGTLPDGMIVGDDVVMKGMALALRDRQIRVPKELSVVCLTNHGVVYPYAVPVVRLEISPTEIAGHLVERLRRQMMGKPAPPPLVQKAVLREGNGAVAKPQATVTVR
jgi:DNA-binding LacI/PurR family transcriptional regulator